MCRRSILKNSFGALCVLCAIGPALASGRFPASGAAARDAHCDAPARTAGAAEHRYRISGKLRIGFFWAGRDDVGTARLTWRSDGTTSVAAFIVGSDPQRAPRNINQWGYLREEKRGDGAEVFALRSVDADDVEPTPGVDAGAGPLFGISCSSIRGDDVRSAVTTVSADAVTYRMFDRLLDPLSDVPDDRWQKHHVGLPPGADVGFLSALQHLMGAASDSAQAECGPISYIYNDTVYSVIIRGSDWLGPATVGSRTYDRLRRKDFVVVNRTTKHATAARVTYSETGSGIAVPVEISVQPSFWVRIVLRLDDAADPPPDPATEDKTLSRIRSVCAGAIRLPSTTAP